MKMFRRVLAIVTKSFYHCNRRQIKKSIKKPRGRSSTRKSIVYHSNRAQSTSTNTTSPGVISIEYTQKKKAKSSSSRKRLSFIAAVTSLPYIGYKYYFHDGKESKNDNKAPVKSGVLELAQEMVENVVLRNCKKDMIFKLGVWCDQNKRYKKALYFYKLYLRDAPSKKGEHEALNNLIVVYYRFNEYDLALTAFELIGSSQTISRNLEFIKAHCHHTLLQYDLAIVWYKKYLKNPSSSAYVEGTYNNLALLYYDLGQCDKSYQYFMKLGGKDKDDKNQKQTLAKWRAYLKWIDKQPTYRL